MQQSLVESLCWKLFDRVLLQGLEEFVFPSLSYIKIINFPTLLHLFYSAWLQNSLDYSFPAVAVSEHSINLFADTVAYIRGTMTNLSALCLHLFPLWEGNIFEDNRLSEG